MKIMARFKTGPRVKVALAVGVFFICCGSLYGQSATPNIGVLTPGLAYGAVLEGLREGLAQLGYREGKNFSFTIEDTKGETVNLAPRSAKLIEAKPDLLFAVATAHAVALKQGSSSLPIVFTMVGHPIQAQLIAGFASSRNNVTGVSSSSVLLTAKRLELVRDILPRAKSILVVVPINEPSAKSALPNLESHAKQLGLRVVRRDVVTPEDLDKVLAEKWQGVVDAMFPLPSVLVSKNIAVLVREANAERLPLIVYEEGLVKSGALASYGTDFRAIGAQSAKLVVKILRGGKPADIPVETPASLVLSLNRSAAKAIGLKIPDKILERADQIFD